MKIYTRYGDDGQTQLLGGQTTRKNDIRVAVCGTLDELNAVLGIVHSLGLNEPLASWVPRIQSEMLVVGTMVASLGAKTVQALPELNPESTDQLEREIDQMANELKPLQQFLLPGGTPAAAQMHLARATCRRAERLVADAVDAFPHFDTELVLPYLNRLSDWCFISARWLNHVAGVEEPLWDGRST